jgi:hypothetical protein
LGDVNVPFAVLGLFVAVFFFGFAFAVLRDETLAVGEEEGLEVLEEILFLDAEIPVEQEEELAFHEVDFGKGEAEAFEAFDDGVAGPMLVLGAGVVEVLGGENE